MKTTIAAIGVLTLVASVSAQKVQIQGAGATFPNPIYSKWFSEYNKLHPNVEINYQPIGSGGGIRQITNQTVFFGATDGPMTNDQLLAAPSKILHFPTVLDDQKQNRRIFGVAYWFPHQGNVSSAILFDYDGQRFDNITTTPTRAVAIHGLVSF